jgi:hypothetical protein
MSQKIDEKTLKQRYEEGIRAFERQRGQRAGEAQALGVLFEGYGDLHTQNPWLPKAGRLAMLFCFNFACIAPVLLMLFVIL